MKDAKLIFSPHLYYLKSSNTNERFINKKSSIFHMAKQVQPDFQYKVEGIGAAGGFKKPWDVALSCIRNLGAEVISTEEFARARTSLGKEHYLTTNGGYTCAGNLKVFNASSLHLKLRNPLLQKVKAIKAVDKNRENRYLSTEDARLYEQFLKIAEREQKQGISPFERQVLIFPNEEEFLVSPTQNSELFAGLFGENGKAYIDLLGLSSIKVYNVSNADAKSYSGTIITPAWLCRFYPAVGVRSGLNCRDGLLEQGDAVVWVRHGEHRRCEAVAKKSNAIKGYNLQQKAEIRKAVKTALRTVPIGKLEAEVSRLLKF
jgi:hypothetical protein